MTRSRASAKTAGGDARSSLRKALTERMSRSTQPTAEGRHFADHLASCLLADATLGIVQVRPFAIGGDPVWRTPVSMVTITPAGDGSWSPAVVVARGTMSIEQAEEVAAGLLAAAAAARYCGGRGGDAPIDLPPQLA